MKANVRRRAREGDDGGNEILRVRPRRVDDDVRRPELLERCERPLPVLLVEPAPVAELDQHLVAAKLLLRPLEVGEGGGLADDVGGKLEQDPPELSGGTKRLERAVEAGEDLASKLA